MTAKSGAVCAGDVVDKRQTYRHTDIIVLSCFEVVLSLKPHTTTLLKADTTALTTAHNCTVTTIDSRKGQSSHLTLPWAITYRDYPSSDAGYSLYPYTLCLICGLCRHWLFSLFYITQLTNILPLLSPSPSPPTVLFCCCVNASFSAGNLYPRALPAFRSQCRAACRVLSAAETER